MMVTGLSAILLTIALLLLIVSLIQPLAKKLELAETVLLAIVGIFIGGLSDILLRSSYTSVFDGVARTMLSFPINSEAFLLIFLPALVYQGALAIDVRRLAHETGTVLLLAVVAVFVSMVVIGYVIHPFTEMSLVVCMLIGAIVATTDPSAVVSIFRDIGATSRLVRLVEGEALLNDAAAISIVSILLSAITANHSIMLGEALFTFLTSFVGGFAIGVVIARVMLYVAKRIEASTAAEITTSVAVPYIVYIVSEEIFHFSGVVAVAASGLTFSVYGPSIFKPQTWRAMHEIWEQIVFWLGSLVFILSAMLVPRLLEGMTRWDCFLVLIAVIAGLIARGLVVFGLLPILAATRLSPPVPTPYKFTMVWGGLRGAITLALALAVTENEHVSSEVARFVGIIATGFVLVTLLVNGTTLRSMVLFFRLDQLSPIDQAMRHQIFSTGLAHVRERTRDMASELGFSSQVTGHIIESLDRRVEQEQEANTFDTALNNRQRVSLALMTIANQERSLLLDLFRIQGISRSVLENLLRSTEAMVEGARTEGRYGYIRALRRGRLTPSLWFKISQFIHHRFHIDSPLMYCMMERFEMLMVARLVSMSLVRFMRRRIEPTLGSRVAEIVSEVLERQQKLLTEALDTLRVHYYGYADALENRLLRQISLRLEIQEYDVLLSESLISEELYRELYKDVIKRSERLARPLKFNLKSGIETRINTLPAFRGVPTAVLHDLAMSVSMRFTSPGERLYHIRERVKVVYFISAGMAETHIDDSDIRFGPGDVLGAEEVMENERMKAPIRSLQFGQLLVVSAKNLKTLIEDYPIIRQNIRNIIYNRPRIDYAPEPILLPSPHQLKLEGHTSNITKKG